MHELTRQASGVAAVAETVYAIDRDNRLISFNTEWDDFARENGSDALVSPHLVGMPLLDFIAGAEMRHLHEVLLKRVRSGRRIEALPFRCDAPELRRFMEMDISLLDDENIEYRCRTVWQEARPSVVLDIAEPGSDEFLRMCSWCKKVRVAEDQWYEIEAAIAKLGLFSQSRLRPISHSMCQSCMTTLYGEAEDKDDAH